MASPIHCDVHNREHLADVMVTRLADGETFAACDLGYIETCRAVVSVADQAEADATDAAATAALADAHPPTDPPTSSASSGADGPPAEPPTSAVGGPGTGGVAQRTTRRPLARPSPSTEPTEATAEVADPA